MRQRLALAAALMTALVLSALAPTAAAAKSTLEIDASAPATADGSIPVVVVLAIDGFMCHEPRDFHILLTSQESAGVTARLSPETLTIHVPAHAYFVDNYRAKAEGTLHVNASVAGDVVIAAYFEAATGPCFVPGGFESASAATRRTVEADAEPAPAPTEDDEKAPTPPTDGPRTCSAAGYCGFIGDYDGTVSKKESPAAALGVLIGGILVVALARRRSLRGTGKP